MSAAIVSLHHEIPMTTSLAIADGVELSHKSVIQLVRKYMDDLHEFGTLAFEMRKSGGRYTEFAYLNEPQATLLMTFMRNSEIVIEFKKALVRAFFELRDAAQALPHRGNPMNLNHRADISVSADRTFRAWMRSCRAAGMATPQALQIANEKTLHDTGVDMLDSMGIAEDVQARADKVQMLDAVNKRNSCELFLDDWVAGELDVPLMACAIRDLFDLYERWCALKSERYWFGITVFSKAVAARPDMKRAVKFARYSNGSCGSVRMVIPAGFDYSGDMSVQLWAGKQCEEFLKYLDGEA